MFGIGIGEVFLILVLAVVLVGPKQLPEVARTVGKTVTRLRRTANEFRDAVADEFQHRPELKDIREIKETLDAGVESIKQQAGEYVLREMRKERDALDAAKDAQRTLENAVADLGVARPNPFADLANQVNQVKDTLEGALENTLAPRGDQTAVQAPTPGPQNLKPRPLDQITEGAKPEKPPQKPA